MSQGCYIVTGAGGSIGYAIAEELARQGKWVVMACRNLQKDTPLRDRLNTLYKGRVSIMQLDLASLDNIAAFARRIHDDGITVQALINNAGVMCKHFTLTRDGYETTIGVNFVGTYLLTKLLIPAMAQGGNIVFTTSMTRHIGTVDKHFYDAMPARYARFKYYSRSKLAVTLLTAHMATLLDGQGIHVNATDPGVVNSNMIHMDAWFDPLADRFFRPFISTPAQGAIGAVAAATATDVTQSIFKRRKHSPIPRNILRHPYLAWLFDETDHRLAPWLQQAPAIASL